jgi:hypothetical protein
MLIRIIISSTLCAVAALGWADAAFPKIPKHYLEEVVSIPEFWLTTVAEVSTFLDSKIRKGTVRDIGTTAGGRRMRAVFYGDPRREKGTTTFSGSLGFRNVRAYLGADHQKKVYMGMAAVHGGELEAIAGMVNLLSVLETGHDLRGREWPEITEAAKQLDRIILLPITNVDGRARVPFRMLRHWGSDYTVPEYFNTGAHSNGELLGWPGVKQFIPLDFSKTQFPGGYPNDAGVNIQHDDFFGNPQPETRALFDLTARERPDMFLNMHTGATFPEILKEFIEPALLPAWEDFYRRTNTALTKANLRQTNDIARESDPSKLRTGPFNLSTALNLHSGVLAVLIESPSHASSSAKRDGKAVIFTPDDLVTAQLICHQEAMKFLVETGGRGRWSVR